MKDYSNYISYKDIMSHIDLKEGDIVMFGKYSGEDVTVEDVEYKVLEEKDVLAVVE